MYKNLALLTNTVLCAFTVSCAIAGNLPSRQAPDNFKSYDDATGARIVVGSVGQFSTPKDAFRAGVGQFKGYFDPSPKIVKAVQNKKGNLAIVAFKGSLQGDKIVGLAVVKCLQSGDSRLDIAYGEPKTFIANVKDLIKKMNDLDSKVIAPSDASASTSKSSTSAKSAKGGSSDGVNVTKYVAASKKVKLTKATSPDGTITIGIASGFQPLQLNLSSCVLKADDGAYLKYDSNMFALDPRSSTARALGRSSGNVVQAMYNPDPITAWKNLLTASSQLSGQPDPDIHVAKSSPFNAKGMKASQSTGTLNLNGTEYSYTNIVGLTPPDQSGSWNITMTILAAPSDKLSADFPKLIAMLHSAHLDQKAAARANQIGMQQIAINERMNNEIVGTYMAESQYMQDSSDRSAAAFDNNLLNQEVITDSEGYHATVGYDVGDMLTHADPNEFSEVPTSDYEPGVDY
jgi:hypothetical protein